MAFDIGAGLAEMGKTVSQTAGTMLIDREKADLDKERLILADELAGKRQDKQNEFTKSERIDTQTYQSGEKEKDRTWQGGENEKNRAVQREGHGVSLAVARMGIDARKEEAALDRQARAEEHRKTLDAQIAAHSVFKTNEDGTISIANPVTGKSQPMLNDKNEPIKFRDPERAKAQAESLTASRAQMESLTSRYRIELNEADTQLKAAEETARRSGASLLNPNSTPPAVLQARQRVEDIKSNFLPKLEALDQRTNAIMQYLLEEAKIKTPGPGGDVTLDSFNPKPRNGVRPGGI